CMFGPLTPIGPRPVGPPWVKLTSGGTEPIAMGQLSMYSPRVVRPGTDQVWPAYFSVHTTSPLKSFGTFTVNAPRTRSCRLMLGPNPPPRPGRPPTGVPGVVSAPLTVPD